MYSLSITEEKRQIVLPEIYKDFYGLCRWGIPEKLVGTTLFHQNRELQQGAFELLEENGIENFLGDDDFVFMMHQGYIFWYFKADGNPDPDVFIYSEITLKVENVGLLSEFINQYIN